MRSPVSKGKKRGFAAGEAENNLLHKAILRGHFLLLSGAV